MQGSPNFFVLGSHKLLQNSSRTWQDLAGGGSLETFVLVSIRECILFFIMCLSKCIVVENTYALTIIDLPVLCIPSLMNSVLEYFHSGFFSFGSIFDTLLRFT